MPIGARTIIGIQKIAARMENTINVTMLAVDGRQPAQMPKEPERQNINPHQMPCPIGPINEPAEIKTTWVEKAMADITT